MKMLQLLFLFLLTAAATVAADNTVAMVQPVAILVPIVAVHVIVNYVIGDDVGGGGLDANDKIIVSVSFAAVSLFIIAVYFSCC